MELSRRRLLALVLAAAAAPAGPAGLASAAGPDPATPPDWVRAGVEHDETGAVARVFGLEADLALDILRPATKADVLPDGYVPGDLVSAAARGIPSSGAQVIRAINVDDTRALIEAAAAAGHALYVGSGFRSQAYQADVFAAQVARWGDAEVANRYSARPGHSQHQLGTAIDFTDSFREFRGSPAADWLRDNAHRFGFVLPYTTAAAPRTGYVDEPWHGRWVGQALATRLAAAGYQDWSDADADDALAWVRAAFT